MVLVDDVVKGIITGVGVVVVDVVPIGIITCVVVVWNPFVVVVVQPHMKLEHSWLTQSVELRQPCPHKHFGHNGPPQSIAVSAPSLIPSLQVGTKLVVLVVVVATGIIT